MDRTHPPKPPPIALGESTVVVQCVNIGSVAGGESAVVRCGRADSRTNAPEPVIRGAKRFDGFQENESTHEAGEGDDRRTVT